MPTHGQLARPGPATTETTLSIALLFSLDVGAGSSSDLDAIVPSTRWSDGIVFSWSLPFMDRCFVLLTRAPLEANRWTPFGWLG